MKKNTFCLLLFFISFISCNEDVKKKEIPKESKVIKESKEETYPILKFSKKVFDFKTVSEGEILKADYVFKNPSKDTLRIEYVNPECSCTSYELSSETIPPNGDGYITLVFDTKDRVGKNASYAVVKANTKTKLYKLTLKATVE